MGGKQVSLRQLECNERSSVSGAECFVSGLLISECRTSSVQRCEGMISFLLELMRICNELLDGLCLLLVVLDLALECCRLSTTLEVCSLLE